MIIKNCMRRIGLLIGLVALSGVLFTRSADVFYYHNLFTKPDGWLDTTGDWSFDSTGAHTYGGGANYDPVFTTTLLTCGIIVPENVIGPVLFELTHYIQIWGYESGGYADLKFRRSSTGWTTLWQEAVWTGSYSDSCTLEFNLWGTQAGDTLFFRWYCDAGPVGPGTNGYINWHFKDFTLEATSTQLEGNTWAQIKNAFH